MSIHSVSKKGKRPQNEDKHQVINNLNGEYNKEHGKELAKINFCGLYDGHGGKAISSYLHGTLSKYFMDKRVKYPISSKYINNVYKHLQDMLREKKEMSTNCGSTCLVSLQYEHLSKQYITVLNTGDSRCVICNDKNIGIVITKDHKPNWPEEALRIKKAGGKIYFDGHDWRIKDLSVSRAFGDIESEPFLTNMPEIFTFRLNKTDKFMILACDGLWDVMSNQDVVNFVLDKMGDESNLSKTNIADLLAKYAIKIGSTDNITIIIVFF